MDRAFIIIIVIVIIIGDMIRHDADRGLQRVVSRAVVVHLGFGGLRCDGMVEVHTRTEGGREVQSCTKLLAYPRVACGRCKTLDHRQKSGSETK